MQQLQPDRSVAWNSPSQSQRLRWEIARNRRQLLEIDHPETARVFQKLICAAQEQLERVDGEAER
jgi:hypothetical protein